MQLKCGRMQLFASVSKEGRVLGEGSAVSCLNTTTTTPPQIGFEENRTVQVFSGIRVCNQGGFRNGAVVELCSALGNARVKGFFEMLFIALILLWSKL